jgi:hypothetical protein
MSTRKYTTVLFLSKRKSVLKLRSEGNGPFIILQHTQLLFKNTIIDKTEAGAVPKTLIPCAITPLLAKDKKRLGGWPKTEDT